MMSYDKLAEHLIREHQVKQQKCKEMDDLYLGKRRANADQAGMMVGDWRQESVNQAGPMGLLDVVAQDLEAFIELFEQAPRCELPIPLEPRRNVHIS